MADPLTPDQIAGIATAGAGPVADLAKMAGDSFALTADDIRTYGAGSVADMLRMSYAAAGSPVIWTAPIVSIGNDDPCTVTINASDAQYFQVGTDVDFDSTGDPSLDTPGAVFAIQSVGSNTFKINYDRSAAAGPISTGNVTTTYVAVTPPAMVNIITRPPPRGPVLAEVVPNGYEQAAADAAAAKAKGA